MVIGWQSWGKTVVLNISKYGLLRGKGSPECVSGLENINGSARTGKGLVCERTGERIGALIREVAGQGSLDMLARPERKISNS